MIAADSMRFVAFWDDGQWVAQGLEHDICVQASSLDELHKRIAATVDAERDFAMSKGIEPFANIGPAPQYYLDKWDRATPLADSGPAQLALCA